VDAQAAAQAAGTWLRAWASGDKEEEAKPIEQRIGVCRVANAVSVDVYGISMV